MELKGNIKDFPLPDIIQLVGLGYKTGMLSLTFNKNNKASLFFKKGYIVHATMLKSEGKEAITKMFHLCEGKFHFFAGVTSDNETVNINPTNLLMEAAQLFDEKIRDTGCFDKGDKKKEAHEKKVKILKRDMIKTIKEKFGKKAKRIESLIKSCSNSEIDLMNSCDKIEKYIYVFLDPENSKAIADKMRHLIEEAH